MSSGEIQVAPLISDVVSLKRGPEFFERLYLREPNLLKVVLEPNAE
jgi:L-iditol 2-dehydrogenase